ncbi:HPr family phosphocarrier protein [Domibacillus sp. 8LH]|uniref:HPr family phosphocarrier protein n=1 Tax=Domibacillus TaxID=1433999 RepID=UPI001F59CBB2|nr:MULTISPECIES: HPr family phosphocarrier protein [Domibacillus]MCI2256112.1 HPr family phosphocarrier protein [Domibacillus sp. PGB-M46]MCM3789880.1 HPr family phosphocarrier protein [Domibacillus indicus]WNS78108.1 HPr family phosphocarrier protein [Domibacillus sp. DTU_2020_1001157_1_SI_ALB_TIR_016]
MLLDKSRAQVVVEINQTASKFKSSIVIMTDNQTIDAKSILGLTYSILNSKSFKLEIHGPDEEEAKVAMSSVFWKHSLPVEVV